MKLATCTWIVIENSNRFLILKRALDDFWEAGKWCLPGGRIDIGEDTKTSAIREIREETNIKLIPSDLSLAFQELHTDLQIHVSYFVVIIKEKEAVSLSKEHIDCAWVTIDELEYYPCVPKLKTLSREALKYV